MADPTTASAVEGHWSGAFGTLGDITPPAGTDAVLVFFGGYNFTGDTSVITLDGGASDDSIQTASGGDGTSQHIFAAPATGSALSLAWSGLDAGDSGEWYAVPISSADSTEIAATGFAQTYTQLASATPSTTFNSLTVGDLCTDSAHTFDAGNAKPITQGADQTELFERWNTEDDGRDQGSYEKATGTSVTMSSSITTPVDGNSYTAVVIPTEEAGGGANPKGTLGNPFFGPFGGPI